MNDDLGDRMKSYEAETKTYLDPNSWMIVRIDGKAFHSWTRQLPKSNGPFSGWMTDAMAETMLQLCPSIAATRFAYSQSDEISLVLAPKAQAWFGGSVQKIASVSASMATAHFNHEFLDLSRAYFDARVFAVPDASEAANYLVWRQQDAMRNSVSMFARHFFSHKEVQGLSTQELKKKIINEAHFNWLDLPDRYRLGQEVTKVYAPATTVVHKPDSGPETIEFVRGTWTINPARKFAHDDLVALLDPKDSDD